MWAPQPLPAKPKHETVRMGGEELRVDQSNRVYTNYLRHPQLAADMLSIACQFVLPI